MVPTAGEPPTVPFTDHVTFVFDTPVPDAENCTVAPGARAAEAGVTVTHRPRRDANIRHRDFVGSS